MRVVGQDGAAGLGSCRGDHPVIAAHTPVYVGFDLTVVIGQNVVNFHFEFRTDTVEHRVEIVLVDLKKLTVSNIGFVFPVC